MSKYLERAILLGVFGIFFGGLAIGVGTYLSDAVQEMQTIHRILSVTACAWMGFIGAALIIASCVHFVGAMEEAIYGT